ncbi:hypothetical protein DM860_008440 [Cuscuta australis]|uniref:Serine-threonine/tyrosine-protein kinase catalytic domain-containing protein n=1 Tax=Cuscuta australis TaxID=267555 RepID=A0A328D4L1_9ASTE|nr:hypothetical protein DM860_008440 [Cuscuta australis]
MSPKTCFLGPIKLGIYLTTRCDVYAFGVVLLEMLTRRRVLDTGWPTRELSLMEFVRPHLTHINRLSEILDPRMEGQYSKKTAALVARMPKCDTD